MAKNLKKRLQERQENLKKNSGSGSNGFFYLKEGTLRARPLPVDAESDWAIEVTYFYLGAEIKGVVSPMTFGEPCAIMEAYNKLKGSKSEDDRDKAKTIKPKRRWAVAHIKYKDIKGLEVDTEAGARLILLTNSTYDSLLELWLDEEEAGDFTDPLKGYDVKYKRTGSTMLDTAYSVLKCKESKLAKPFRNEIYNPEDMIKKVIPTYEETQEMVKQVLGGIPGEEEKKKKKKNRD